jgi:hypothetical protein
MGCEVVVLCNVFQWFLARVSLVAGSWGWFVQWLVLL